MEVLLRGGDILLNNMLNINISLQMDKDTMNERQEGEEKQGNGGDRSVERKRGRERGKEGERAAASHEDGEGSRISVLTRPPSPTRRFVAGKTTKMSRSPPPPASPFRKRTRGRTPVRAETIPGS